MSSGGRFGMKNDSDSNGCDFGSPLESWNNSGNGEHGANAGNDSRADENIFDRQDVRILFLISYGLVFCCCIVGNMLVILVVVLGRRLRSTEFFLCNLAIADLCVGLFCVLQTISTYIMENWIFGDFLCKMHYFMHSLSCTSSIFILVVISVERYLVIIHPMRSRRVLTSKRLKFIIISVWIISIVYSSPRFFFARTIHHAIREEVEILCILSRTVYNSKIFDIFNFIVLYLCPLMSMTVLYTLIAVKLRNPSLSFATFQSDRSGSTGLETDKDGTRKTGVVRRLVRFGPTFSPEYPRSIRREIRRSPTGRVFSESNLRTRRGVIRLLVIVVLAFAVCNVWHHARKMWQYWSPSYDASSNLSSLLTPVTFLLTYCNSAVNPLLYAFLSKNFRAGMRGLATCDFRPKKPEANATNRFNSISNRKSYSSDNRGVDGTTA